MIIFSWVKVSSKTKWQLIGMHKMKMSNRQIGRYLNISEFSVLTTKNYLSTGSVNDKLRIGRPKNCQHAMKHALHAKQAQP